MISAGGILHRAASCRVRILAFTLTGLRGKSVRKLLILWCVVLFSVHAFAIETLTVAQFEQGLSKVHGRRDKRTEKYISGVQLTERLRSSEFDRLNRRLKGERSRTALRAIADASAFLDLPRSELLPDPAPYLKLQGEILIQAGEFAGKASKRMPNFLAHRVTTRFLDGVTYPYSSQIHYFTPGVFHLYDSRTVGVRYINGREEVAESHDHLKREGDITQSPPGLTTWGAFGPLLDTVMGDILQSKVGWDHWERSGSDRIAVFRFFVPKEKLHYTVEYCCTIAPRGGMTEFQATPTYHGKIAIDPVNQHVVRIVLICDLAPGQAISRADVELEYGPVEIAGQSYVLPVRGVSASAVPFSNPVQNGSGQYDAFSLTSVNDLQFTDYRVFRTEMKILPTSSLDGPAH